MIVIKTLQDIEQHNYTNDNRISGIKELNNSSIIFRRSGNVFIGEDVILKNSRIVFQGNNSLVYLSNSHRIYYLTISSWNNNTVYIGKNCSFNGVVTLSLSEEQSIFVGDTCMFSSGITFYTADPHLIYSTQTHCRVNPSKSIFLGDHIWIGRNVAILKGARVHSGSILALNSVVTGSREIPSNVVVGGNPAKIISNDIFWLPDCVHSYTTEKTQKSQQYTDDKFVYNVYQKNANIICFDEIVSSLYHQSIENRVRFLQHIGTIQQKERFASHNNF